MTKNLKFAILSAWILFSRSYDAYCTNRLTPNLDKEANPLVSILGLGWTPLLLLLSALTIYTLYAFYLSVYKPFPLLPDEKGYSLSNIAAFTYLGQKDEWYALLYKLPKSFSRFNQYMGEILTRCLVFAGIVSTVMWLLINHVAYYRPMHSAPVIYATLVLGCVIIIYLWNNAQYRRYLTKMR